MSIASIAKKEKKIQTELLSVSPSSHWTTNPPLSGNDDKGHGVHASSEAETKAQKGDVLGRGPALTQPGPGLWGSQTCQLEADGSGSAQTLSWEGETWPNSAMASTNNNPHDDSKPPSGAFATIQ